VFTYLAIAALILFALSGICRLVRWITRSVVIVLLDVVIAVMRVLGAQLRSPSLRSTS
jgi:hypothetical protein